MSDETKWTKGPWTWSEDRFHGGWTGLFGANDLPVLYPQRENDGDDGAAWFANDDDAGEEGLSDADRNLIAAAPDLYAELKTAHDNLYALITDPEIGHEVRKYFDLEDVAAMARPLAKARGETS